jgi:hypothetical protein
MTAMEPAHSKQDDEKALEATYVSEKEVNEEARVATSKEHGLGVRQGLSAYRKAVGWSILLSSAVIMEGYDTILVRLNLKDTTDIRLDHTLALPPSTTHLAIKLSTALPPSLLRGRVLVSHYLGEAC